jgi:hypothetical protein
MEYESSSGCRRILSRSSRLETAECFVPHRTAPVRHQGYRWEKMRQSGASKSRPVQRAGWT